MRSNYINLEFTDQKAVITIDRPAKKNALTDEMFLDIIESLQTIKEHQDCKVVVIKGTDGVFCSGRDISSFQRIQKLSTSYEIRNEYDLPVMLNLELRNFPIPTVAVIQGYAMGAGAGIATWCDVALAEQTAKFSYSEINLGLAPTMVCVELLRSVPKKKAIDLLLTGRMIDADEAESMGLITRSIAVESFEDEVEQYITNLASKSKPALELAKDYLTKIENMEYTAALSYGMNVSSICTASKEAKEAINSFLTRNNK
jgi:enoyl-CoA hydratase/carnithine racemase